MTIGTLIIAFTNYVVGSGLILVLYTWYLVMVVSLGLGLFPIWSLSLFFNRLGPSSLGFLDVLLTRDGLCLSRDILEGWDRVSPNGEIWLGQKGR